MTMIGRPGATSFPALSFAELAARLGSRTRALQARRWLYAGGEPPPAELPEIIPGVSAASWRAVRESAPLPAWRALARQQAEDGTLKLALELGTGAQAALAETVLIPGPGRSTVCLSSQSGCSRRCAFCATATLGFRRQLDCGEILMQYALARAAAPADAPARNVVFMGMGEPLDNLDAVLPAVERLTDEGAPGLGAAHVTVSTAGVLPGMRRFLRASRAQLALSLNATSDAQREALMPHNRAWPIAALLGALRDDAASGSGRRYFIEYVLLRGVNDTDDDARRLVALLAGLPAHVNLIPGNAYTGGAFAAPDDERARRFQRLLAEARLRAIIRWPRGRGIAAACGQLAGRSAA